MFNEAIEGCETVLDAGCGADSILLQLGINHKQITGLDIWGEYAKRHQGDKRYVGYYQADVTKVEFPARSFDVVILSDVIEHIPKGEVLGSKLFDKISTWAKKKVIIMTPYGFVDNSSYGGNPFLYHKSGWTSNELREHGFRVRSTFRVRRKKYWRITGLEWIWTIFAVKECSEEGSIGHGERNEITDC